MDKLNITILDKDGRMKDTAGLEEKAGAALKRMLAGEEQYMDALGWFDPDAWAGEARLDELEQMAQDIRAKADAFVIVGVGGSNQAARAVIEGLRATGGPQIVYAGNTLSAYELRDMLQSLEGKRFCIDVIAKNFETLEPGLSFRLLRDELLSRYGENAKDYIYTTVTEGSYFEELSLQNGYTTLYFPGDIGGRYSVFSDVGLLPMAVAGVDIHAMLNGARDMRARLLVEGGDSPAAVYAIARNLYNHAGYKQELFSFFEPRWRYFAKWWVQLFGESEGKQDKGIFPASAEYSEDLHAIGQFVQEGTPVIFETFLTVSEKDAELPIPPDTIGDRFDYLEGTDVWEVNHIAQNATIEAHSARLPCIVIEVPALSAYWMGQLFYLFMFACYLSGSLLGVNPFDQDGVEAYKNLMFQSLGKQGGKQ